MSKLSEDSSAIDLWETIARARELVMEWRAVVDGMMGSDDMPEFDDAREMTDEFLADTDIAEST